MFDGVLDQRLEHQGGDKGRQGFRLGVDLDLQAIGEADLLDFQVAPDELKFLGDGVSAVSRLRRKKSLRRAIMRLASAFFPSDTKVEIAFRVLKRK